MNDFIGWLVDKRPFLALACGVSLLITASGILAFILVLANEGHWIPFAATMALPLVWAAVLYFKRERGEGGKE